MSMNIRQKKALYESIMKSVAKTVKRALNESKYNEFEEDYEEEYEDEFEDDSYDSFYQTQAQSYGDLKEISLDCPVLGPVTLIYDEDEEGYYVYDESDYCLGIVDTDVVAGSNANDDQLEQYLDEQFA